MLPKTLIAVFIAFSLVACGGVSKKQRAENEREYARLLVTPPAVVSDGCEMSPAQTVAVVQVSASRNVGRKAGTAVASYLRERGIAVRNVRTPFICGLLPEPAADALRRVTDTSGETAVLPLVADAAIADDALLSASYRMLFDRLRAHHVAPANPEEPNHLNLDPSQARLLQEAMGVSDLWVVRAGNASPGPDLALVNLYRNQVLWSGSAEALAEGADRAIPDRAWAVAALRNFMPPSSNTASRALLNPEVPDDPGAAEGDEPLSEPGLPPDVLAAYGLSEADEHGNKPIHTLALPSATGSIQSLEESAAAAAPEVAEIPAAAKALESDVAAPQIAAAAPPALTASDAARVLSKATALRKRPTLGGEVVREMSAGTDVEVEAALQNADGSWWYVRVASEEGWMLAQ